MTIHLGVLKIMGTAVRSGNLVKDIFETMEYGPAPEAGNVAKVGSLIIIIGYNQAPGHYNGPAIRQGVKLRLILLATV